ncbi:MAG: DNA polymerase III subunit chi [Ghiorsea sp.]|nr:DNA polymerase III subunit chi [Ghiorsea sp.]
METKVHFELLEHADRIKGIANLLLRRNRLTPHVLVLCPDDDFMQQLDETLWTIHFEAFLPHAIATDDRENNAKQPILLAEFQHVLPWLPNHQQLHRGLIASAS